MNSCTLFNPMKYSEVEGGSMYCIISYNSVLSACLGRLMRYPAADLYRNPSGGELHITGL